MTSGLKELKAQFECCVKMLRNFSDDDKKEAIKHIRTVLSEFDLKVEWKSEYMEYPFKEEERMKPDIPELANLSNNAAVKLEESMKRKHDEGSVTTVVKDNSLNKTNISLASSKPEQFFKRSLKQQVEELATDNGMEMEYVFLKPAGCVYRIGQRAVIGDYEVCLTLTRGDDDDVVEQFSGSGSYPYDAIRNACKKAKKYLF